MTKSIVNNIKNIATDNTITMFFILFTIDFVIQQIYQL